MCKDDHGINRRTLLHGSVALALAAGLGRGSATGNRLQRRASVPAGLRRPQITDPWGNAPWSNAMHIHTSGSEYGGSLQGQFNQAEVTQTDILWLTDHIQRMGPGWNYRSQVSFTDPDQPPPGQGPPWNWVPARSGPIAYYSGGIVATPSSPGDPQPGGSMQLAAASADTSPATYGFEVNASAGALNYRDSLWGQSISIDVLLDRGWKRGYLEVRIESSYHPPQNGRPGGYYTLSYQLAPPTTAASMTTSGLDGIRVIPVTPDPSYGGWATITLNPSDDIATWWPDENSYDFAMFNLTLNAVSTGDQVSGYFSNLQFSRASSGEIFLQQQLQAMSGYAPAYPSVQAVQGIEWSLGPASVHLNQFGGTVAWQGFASDMTEAEWVAYLAQTVVPDIHGQGGVLSYNHPFGTASTTGHQSSAAQAKLLAQAAPALLPQNGQPAILGADLLEVGYNWRGGCDMAAHLALWDILSANCCFITGIGVSDDHIGQNWAGDPNNFTTTAWSASTAVSDLQAAMVAGRAWFGSLSEFSTAAGVALDCLTDGVTPMGGVMVSQVPAHLAVFTAVGVPAGGRLVIWAGDIDYADPPTKQPNSEAVASFTASELAASGGTATWPVTVSADGLFYRPMVVDANANNIAGGQPTWILTSAPSAGIPASRQQQAP